MLHPTMFNDVGPTMLASFEQALTSLQFTTVKANFMYTYACQLQFL